MLLTVTLIIIAGIIPGTLCFDDDRVFDADISAEAEFPYQVSLRWSNSLSHFCGGSIIAPRHILTAAHCVKYKSGEDISPSRIRVVAGQNALTINQHTVLRKVSRIHVHDYNIHTKENDIAIMEVSEAFPIGDGIDIADIQRDEIKPGSKCTVSGWGIPKRGTKNLSEELQAAEIKVIGSKQCQDIYTKINETLYPGMMCAGDPDIFQLGMMSTGIPDVAKDASQGDSGGPLSCDGLLTGIVSTGKKSNVTVYPGIYTEVANYIPWIKHIINSTNAPTDIKNHLYPKSAHKAE